MNTKFDIFFPESPERQPAKREPTDRQQLDRELSVSLERLLARLVGPSDLSALIDVRQAWPTKDEFYAWSGGCDAETCPADCGAGL